MVVFVPCCWLLCGIVGYLNTELGYFHIQNLYGFLSRIIEYLYHYVSSSHVLQPGQSGPNSTTIESMYLCTTKRNILAWCSTLPRFLTCIRHIAVTLNSWPNWLPANSTATSYPWILISCSPEIALCAFASHLHSAWVCIHSACFSCSLLMPSGSMFSVTLNSYVYTARLAPSPVTKQASLQPSPPPALRAVIVHCLSTFRIACY